MSTGLPMDVHTEPPVFREGFKLPIHEEGEFCLELRAVELLSELKYALLVDPSIRLEFANYLQAESFRTAIRGGRKTVTERDVLEAYQRIYN